MARPFIDPFGADLPTGVEIASLSREQHLAAVATLYEYAYGATLHAQHSRDVATQRALLHATLALAARSAVTDDASSSAV
jgi:hypothetical protein